VHNAVYQLTQYPQSRCCPACDTTVKLAFSRRYVDSIPDVPSPHISDALATYDTAILFPFIILSGINSQSDQIVCGQAVSCDYTG
jgi:hypothetical protein